MQIRDVLRLMLTGATGKRTGGNDNNDKGSNDSISDDTMQQISAIIGHDTK